MKMGRGRGATMRLLAAIATAGILATSIAGAPANAVQPATIDGSSMVSAQISAQRVVAEPNGDNGNGGNGNHGDTSELGSDDPALQQTVTDDEHIAAVGEHVVASEGHFDLGPIVVDNAMQFLVRDDSQDQPVWRNLDDVVFQVGANAIQTLPESGDYDFVGAKGGQQVWAVPQSQIAGVPWLGWNTQSPRVTQDVSRGITLEYGGHQGPGQFTLFLQAGGFGAPQQLWSSAKAEAQGVWVDLKTHTHANWVFTEPGIHLVRVVLKAKMIDGSDIAVPATLRFAVGDVNPEDAFAATWSDDSAVAAASTDNAQPQDTDAAAQDRTAQTSSTFMLVGGILCGAAVVLVLAALILTSRSRRARSEAQRNVSRADGESPGESH